VDVQLLDVEWLLSTLFDASLLSPLSRRKRRLFFWRQCRLSIGSPWTRLLRVMQELRRHDPALLEIVPFAADGSRATETMSASGVDTA